MNLIIWALLMMSTSAMAENWVMVTKQNTSKYRTFVDKDSIDAAQAPIVSYTVKYEQQPLMFGDTLYFVTKGRLQKYYLVKMQVNCQSNTARSTATKVGGAADFTVDNKPFSVIQKDSLTYFEAAFICNAVHEGR